MPPSLAPLGTPKNANPVLKEQQLLSNPSPPPGQTQLPPSNRTLNKRPLSNPNKRLPKKPATRPFSLVLGLRIRSVRMEYPPVREGSTLGLDRRLSLNR